MKTILSDYIDNELLIHSNSNGKDMCVAGILRDIKKDIILIANQVKTFQDGTFKMIDNITSIPSNDIITISNGQKVIKLR